MSRLLDFRVLARHYRGLFDARAAPLLCDRAARRVLPPTLYRSVCRLSWPRFEVEGPGVPEGADAASPVPFAASEARWLASRFPDVAHRIGAAADRICDHVFDVLGSGPTDWGDPIDWHRDVKSGWRWPTGFYASYRDRELMPGSGADVKVPWELSRLHHLVTLGQAWLLTGEVRYADEFFAQWESWLAANPWPHGINWTSPMEASIRAVNLLWAAALLEGAPGWKAERRLALLLSLWQHGVYIERNLEVGARNGRLVAGNHYVANACGLACLGFCCAAVPAAERWRQVGLRALEQEIDRQILSDGFFYESSTAYHGLALELFLIPAVLARRNGHEMSGAYRRRLEQMCEVILGLTRPDGCVPQVGDGDDGRALLFSDPGRVRQDYRDLLAVAAVIFGRGDFKAAANDRAQEVFWFMGREGLAAFDALEARRASLGSRAFASGGLYVIRGPDGRDCAVVRAGAPAPEAPTGHSHNDALSLELWIDGAPVLVERGTYCYTGDAGSRDWFRSTAAHNTVKVDGREINRIPAGAPFRLGRDARVRILEWHSEEERVRLCAEHDGYARLDAPVTHRRTVEYVGERRTWLVEDRLSGTGSHVAEAHWHFPPGTELSVEEGEARLSIRAGGAQLDVEVMEAQRWTHEVRPAWHSPAYGVREPAPELVVLVRFTGACELKLTAKPVLPAGHGNAMAVSAAPGIGVREESEV